MYSGKKITKEDTWRPADLKRYIRAEEHSDYVRRQDVNERRHRGGESKERQRRDSEKEFTRERDKHEEQESTRDRRGEDKKDKYVDKRKEGSRDRRGDKEQDGRDRERRRDRERQVEINKHNDDYREIRDSRRDREEKHDRERDKEKERVRNRERFTEGDRDKMREERDKERGKEERDREHRTERRRHEESGELRRERTEKYDTDQRDGDQERDRLKDRKEKKTNEKDRHREYKEEHRKHKEERERRHKERGHHEEKQKHDGESREHRDSRRPVGEVRHHHGDRERAERDKHKERRHREEEEPERRQRQEEQEPDIIHRTSSKKSVSSDNSSMHKTNAVETEAALEEDLGEQEYEDDFEDYEEDFEEMDESEKETELSQAEEREELTPQRRKEMEEIQRAMEKENERVGTAQSSQSMSREEEEEDRFKTSKAPEKDQSTGSQHGKFIDFVAAKQREVSKKVATKQKKRTTELLRLIDLDFSMTFSLLDLPPVNEYDMYIRNFGSANTKQAYVQCNEDNTDCDIQTEEIETCDKWTQHPPEGSGACGDPNLSHEARDKVISELNFDSQRLTAFLSSASQVMVVLLEEDQAERRSLRKLGTQANKLSFSEGSSQLNTKLPFLSGRSIHLVHFSQVQRHIMMSVHAPTAQPSGVHLDNCTIICIWNIWEPSRPQKILVYESEIQCCCFSTGKAILVFGGTSVGSVVLWDLREPASNHYHRKIGEDEWTFREPTFSTDAVMSDSGNFCAVTSVEVVSSSAAGDLRPEVPLAASEEELSGMSFQLASLDESGVLNFWVVVDLPKANESGSPTDLGLGPGSKVKLLHSSSLLTVDRVSPRDPVKTGPLQTAHLKFLPADSNHFFIGTNMGLVNHGTSHGLKAPPKFYRFQEPGARPVDITAIQFSPFKQNMFLVGCGDGSVRLHGVSSEQPVAEWKSSTAGQPVLLLQWAQTRPTVFCVLDAASTLHIWDLLKNETEPVVTERIVVDRVTAMAVFGDCGQKNMYSGVALAHESGKLEMHYFTRDFTVSSVADGEKLENMMTEAL